MTNSYKTDVAVIGGGLAGIVSAIELLDANMQVSLFDACPQARFGGMAKDAFGGMLLVDTPIQRKNNVRDSPELALSDWLAAAEFGDGDEHAKQWAEAYVNESIPEIYDWLVQRGITFLPMPHWVERGDFRPGNSVPRYHVIWGTGYELARVLIEQLLQHENKANLTLYFEHKVTEFAFANGQVTGFSGNNTADEQTQPFAVEAAKVIVCAGGINGNLDIVRKYWDQNRYGSPPQNLKAGVAPDADGLLHEEAKRHDVSVINLHQMWNYAAGVAHPQPRYPEHAVSLIPPRSSLWMDATGRRVGPHPMMTGFDTHELCCRTGNLPGQYTWQVMNYKIAYKELAASGSDVNPSFRDKSKIGLLRDVLIGNKWLLEYLIEGSSDVVVANTIEELAAKMNAVAKAEGQPFNIDVEGMSKDIYAFDRQIEAGVRLHNDDQLRRIAQCRNWKGDKLRTCNFQKIMDAKHMPLVAMRCSLVSRKSMGGFETNLQSQVVDTSGNVIPGLYAAGEAAGFGGGGISGIRSLEGTFLSNCIYNARKAVRHIVGR